MKKLLLDYAQYNLWANERLISAFRGQDDGLVSKEIVSSFPSARKTLIHIWDAETLWFERLNGHSPASFPSADFNGPNFEVYDNLLKASWRLAEFIENQPAPFYRESLVFKTLSDPQEYRMKVIDMIQHCINHSSFHRGQLVTMCRQLNVKNIPRTDYILYKRENP